MNRVALGLTKLWLRLLGAKFLKVSVITLSSGEEQNVVVFSSKAYFLLGQVTPWGTTIVHELAFSSDKLLDYIAIHESAHKRQWYRYALYPLVTLWLVVPFMLVSVLLGLVQAVISLDWAYLVGAIIILITSAVVFAVPCFFSWVLEFLADCYAIRELGIKNISEAMADAKALAETRGLGKPDLLTRIIGRMTHPPLTLTYHICRLLHRHEIDDYP
jgi:hypothetical protein